MSKILVIVGSVRPGRIGKTIADWVVDLAKDRPNFEYELVDLKEWNLPFYDEAVAPTSGVQNNELTKKWSAKIAEADGFILVSPEYNFSIPASLKNALDYLYSSWNSKPVAFVTYGFTGGIRVTEHLRQHTAVLEMVPLKAGVTISTPPIYNPDYTVNGEAFAKTLEATSDSATTTLDNLEKWTEGLKALRV